MPIILPVLLSSGPSSAYSATLTSNNSGDEGFTYRMLLTSLIRGSGESSLVRVTFNASTAGSFQTDHCSIGISNGTDADTVDVPVELFFNGGTAGFTIASSGTLTSDWANLGSFDRTKNLVVVMDLTAAGANGNARQLSAVGSGTHYFLAASASYNSATTPVGFSSSAGNIEGLSRVEVR